MGDIEKDNMVTERESRELLKQPNRVVMMKHGFDMTQVRVLQAIIAKLQGLMSTCINGKLDPAQLELFSDDAFEDFSEGKLTLEIDYKDVGISPKNYKGLRESLRRMADIPVDIFHPNKEGQMYETFTHFCETSIPVTCDDSGKVVDTRYKRSFKVMLQRAVVEYLLDSRKGWHSYIKMVVDRTKNKYVPRFYWLISSWKPRGATREYTVKELREWLCMGDKLSRWNVFLTHVIQPVEEELKNLSAQGISDIYFKPEFIYNGRKHRGEPDGIVLHIYEAGESPREVAEAEEISSEPIRKPKDVIKEINRMLMKNFAQPLANRKDILSMVNEKNQASFLLYCQETLPGLVEKYKSTMKNKSSWCYSTIMNFFQEKASPKLVSPVAPAEGMLDRHAAKVAAHTYTADVSEERWLKVLTVCRERWSETEVGEWLEPLKYLGRKNGVVCVKMPTSFFGKQMYAKGYYDRLLSVCRELWPEEKWSLE